jgi:DNA-binding NtrC family response regulator
MTQLLIIDDDTQIRTVLRAMLEPAGYDIVEAANGQEALQCLQAMRVDVIMLDMLMPEEDGLETLSTLRRLDPQVKIIAISGGGQTGAVDVLTAAVHLGAHRTLQKPFTRQELIEAVRALLQGADADTQTAL